MSVDKIITALPAKTAKERDAMRANARAALDHADPKRREPAERLLAAIDAQDAADAQARTERLTAMTVTDRVKEAFSATPLSVSERKTVRALLDHPGATSTELSRICGHAKGKAWHMHFGTLVKKRRAALWPGEFVEKRDAEFFCGILASYEDATSGFKLREEAKDAFAALGLHPRGA
jgi:hypothetical protein